MKNNPNLLWVIALVLGWLVDILFWNQSFGLNFTLFILLCLAGGFLYLILNKKFPGRATLGLIPFILFFAAVPLFRAEPMTIFLGVLFTLFLMAVFAISYLGGRWLSYSLADYASGFVKLILSLIARPLMFNAEVQRQQAESGQPRRKVNIWPVVRGLLIALPIVTIFALLLSSADTIFGSELNDFIKIFFDLERLPEIIFRLIYILVAAYVVSGAFLHAASQSQDEKLLGEEKPLVSRLLGFTESTIVLGSVIVLFTAFVIVQFKYFFGGQANLGPGGLTDSEYARRGFGELATVAFLSLLMMLGLSTITQRETALQRRVFSGLGVGIAALVLVILVSAYQRLLLNELAHGFFRLRTYSHVFYIWLGLLFVAVAILEVLHRERAFALAALLAAIGFAITLTLINVDGFIVRQDIQRAMEGKYLNIADLSQLSQDSVPALVDEFLSPAPSATLHEELGVILVCHIRYSDTTPPMGDWRSFTYSKFAEKAALDKVRSSLDEYHLNTDAWPFRVRTPSSEVYECR